MLPYGGQFGDYQLLKLLGEGGMGAVYLAEPLAGGELVAIKIIASHLARSSAVARRFEAEARAVMRIRHPNVIRIHDYGRLEDGTLYHVMEVLDGVELTQLLDQKPKLTPRQALPFVHQICMGLQAAHEQKIIHRDLKPENIYVLHERSLSLKVLDFGIAKLLDPGEFLNLTATGVAIGTPMFIAPEQAMGNKELIGPQTDLYSLGVMLYMMLSGKPPFEGTGVGILLTNHIRDEPPPLGERVPNLPEAVVRVVHQCLEKDPEKRPHSARDLDDAYLRAISDAEPATAVEVQSLPPQMTFEPRATAPGEASEARDTVYDPRFHTDDDAKTRDTDLTGARRPGRQARTPDRVRNEVPPSALLGPEVARRTLSGRRVAHWLALAAAGAGILLIVVLVVLIVRLLTD